MSKLEQATHQAFSWLPQNLIFDDDAQFVARTRNLAAGIGTCMGIIHADLIASDTGANPILDGRDTDAMMRFIMEVSATLADIAGDRIELLAKLHANAGDMVQTHHGKG